MARKMVAPKADSTFHSTTDKTSECKRIAHRPKHFNSGTEEKHTVGMLRLEDLWANSFRQKKLGKTCISKYPAFLVQSTLDQCIKCINQFLAFCAEVEFTDHSDTDERDAISAQIPK